MSWAWWVQAATRLWMRSIIFPNADASSLVYWLQEVLDDNSTVDHAFVQVVNTDEANGFPVENGIYLPIAKRLRKIVDSHSWSMPTALPLLPARHRLLSLIRISRDVYVIQIISMIKCVRQLAA